MPSAMPLITSSQPSVNCTAIVATTGAAIATAPKMIMRTPSASSQPQFGNCRMVGAKTTLEMPSIMK